VFVPRAPGAVLCLCLGRLVQYCVCALGARQLATQPTTVCRTVCVTKCSSKGHRAWRGEGVTEPGVGLEAWLGVGYRETDVWTLGNTVV
jgi:hypothetical protein